ncbi:hypothetical protein IR010_11385 [Flavobacterium sp. MR2016-29]|uniref:hypothetical protein n=1 Tax=Flavobacterium sp. MR2016-29 TaxID=2783795 RepID=UPI00188C87D5|nr:hypothetical protein [Flavobacterium sp. MR2016-29]MBF4493145.1 hypothetical protein [Flavobacterium sp. MR2016-29]
MEKKAKNLFIVALSCFAMVSCKKETIKSIPTTDSTSIKIDALKTDSAVINPSDTLKSLVDKSVIGTHLLTNSSITPRLKTLLGTEYDQMVKYWNTETPFTKEGDILHAGGCKQHDCTTYSYDLYIDAKNNKINVYKFSQSKLTVFAEDNFRIILKDSLLQDLNTKKINANIEKKF